MQIALIGTGNVAWHLAQAFTAAGHQIAAVVSRTASAGEEFARSFAGMQHVQLQDLKKISLDVIILAVPDATLRGVAANMEVSPGTIVVHTSGSQPLEVLDTITGARTGVFYPVQTFTKYKPVNFYQVPVLLEGKDETTVEVLTSLANSISGKVQITDSASRKQLHLAAVFACNFTNHLFGISQAILTSGNLPPDLLQPLIRETISKSETNNPFDVQTGPATRHDENVIQEHLQSLKDYPAWQELYRTLTRSIQEQKTSSTGKAADNE